MAILKHTSSKNMSYGDALRYLKYKHQEDPRTGRYKPILDAYGLLQERENCALCYLDGYGREHDPEDWVGACSETNLVHRKNNTREERKQHTYIIAHPAEDCPLLTREKLLEEGKAFVRENLQGYDALIAVHMDTDHYHLHISINSVRTVARQDQPWMLKDSEGNALPCEVKAGGKHQDSPLFRRHCQQWLMEYTRSHGYTVKDNLSIEDERKESVRVNKYQKLREILLDCAFRSSTYNELVARLRQEHNIGLVRRGSTYTVHPPDSQKGIRLKTLELNAADLVSKFQNTDTVTRPENQTAYPRIERKTYYEWLMLRRIKNDIRAQDNLADVASLISAQSKENKSYHSYADFRELENLLSQTIYVQRDLNTELDKIQRLLYRWELYYSYALSQQERQSHAAYVKWCGCDPDSTKELQCLRLERDAVKLQLQEASTIQKALMESADQWTSDNSEKKFEFHQEWVLTREEQLKHQLRHIRANRKKLEKIAYTCQMAAGRRIYKDSYLEKAAYFRQLWHEKLQKEKALKAEIKRLQGEKKQNEKPSHKKSLGR